MEKDLQEQDFSEFMAKLPVFALIKMKAFFLVVAGIVTKKFRCSSRTFFNFHAKICEDRSLWSLSEFDIISKRKKDPGSQFFQLWSKVDYFPQ